MYLAKLPQKVVHTSQTELSGKSFTKSRLSYVLKKIWIIFRIFIRTEPCKKKLRKWYSTYTLN